MEQDIIERAEYLRSRFSTKRDTLNCITEMSIISQESRLVRRMEKVSKYIKKYMS